MKVESGSRKILQIPESRSDKHGILVDPRNIASRNTERGTTGYLFMFKVDKIFRKRVILLIIIPSRNFSAALPVSMMIEI